MDTIHKLLTRAGCIERGTEMFQYCERSRDRTSDKER